MIIEDGTGTGSKAKVRSDNQLDVHATTINFLEHLNEDRGKVWTASFDGLAPSGATKFFYISNTGTGLLGIAGVRFASTVAGVFRFLKVTGTPAGGTTVVPMPCSLGSPVLAHATILSGTSITGLTDAGLLVPLYLQANVSLDLDLPSRWYLPPNTALAIQAPGAAVVNGDMLIFEEDGN